MPTQLAALGRTDGQMDGQKEGGAAAQRLRTAKEGARETLARTHMDAGDGGHKPITLHTLSPMGAGMRGAWAGRWAPGLLAPGEGAGASTVWLPSSVVQPILGPSWLRPVPGADFPVLGWQLFSFGSFLCQRVGRAGGARASLDGDL